MKAALAIIGGIIAVVALIAGIWVLGVVLSDPIGQGEAIKQKNTATNRTQAQQEFEKRYADVKAADQRVDAAARKLKKNPESEVAQTNYNGLINYCLSVVNEYNSFARTWTAQDFKSVDLPNQIDQLDPSTDCKEAA